MMPSREEAKRRPSETGSRLAADLWARRTLSRRQILRLLAIASAAPLVRIPSSRGAFETPAPTPSSPQAFFSADERAILDAAAARIIPTDTGPPTDTSPGAREVGVVDYIESFLTFGPGSDANCDRLVNAADVTATAQAFSRQESACRDAGDVMADGTLDQNDVEAAPFAVFRAHPVFGGGPFSGRNPQAHFDVGTTACSVCHGVSSHAAAATSIVAAAATVDVFPPNAFREHLPLTRLQSLSWKVRLRGPDAVPGLAEKNPLVTELLEVDLRRKYKDHLTLIDAIARRDKKNAFVELPPMEQSQVLSDPALGDFVKLLTFHTIEGTLCAPEYGGNRGRLGWQLIHFDGDSQPLGYAIYDESVAGYYRERPDKPNSTPDPDEDCSGFSEIMLAFLSAISGTPTVAPGARFKMPYCFPGDR